MSKHTNVNPDHYKVGGRERQGRDINHEVERREAKRLRKGEGTGSRGGGHVGISNRLSPDEEARDAAEHPPLDANAPPPQDVVGGQTSSKAGSRSMAQKEAGTRHPDDPAPSTRPVPGASGREGQDNE